MAVSRTSTWAMSRAESASSQPSDRNPVPGAVTADKADIDALVTLAKRDGRVLEVLQALLTDPASESAKSALTERLNELAAGENSPRAFSTIVGGNVDKLTNVAIERADQVVLQLASQTRDEEIWPMSTAPPPRRCSSVVTA